MDARTYCMRGTHTRAFIDFAHALYICTFGCCGIMLQEVGGDEENNKGKKKGKENLTLKLKKKEEK